MIMQDRKNQNVGNGIISYQAIYIYRNVMTLHQSKSYVLGRYFIICIIFIIFVKSDKYPYQLISKASASVLKTAYESI